MNRTETIRQADEGAEAWRVPPRRYLREHPPDCEGERLSSRYVSVRDGTRLAVDVHLPGTAPEPGRYPTVVLFTPYYRRFALRSGHEAGVEACLNIAQFRDAFVPRGYAVVAVDVRGCGASFGCRDGFRSPRERNDSFDVVTWIVAQPWCDGQVGSTGISYVGAAADFLASTGHPAVKAVVPTFSVWDTWSNHLYPGPGDQFGQRMADRRTVAHRRDPVPGDSWFHAGLLLVRPVAGLARLGRLAGNVQRGRRQQ